MKKDNIAQSNLYTPSYVAAKKGRIVAAVSHTTVLLHLCVLILFCSLSSCHHQQPTPLNASEVFFDETLASISPDNIDNHLFYIGTEDGVVYTYNADDGTIHRWCTDFDRIYKVMRDPSSPKTDTSSIQDGTIYWVGTRNMGVIQCKLHGDSLVMLQQYALPRATRGIQYSAYDIHKDTSGLYVATSHGLFYLPNNSETLQVLYATWEISGESAYHPMVTSDIKRLKNGKLVCTSASGVLSIDTLQHKANLLLSGNYTSIACNGDTILALSGDSIVSLLPNGRAIGKTKLPYQAYILFNEPSAQMNYLINGTTIQFVSNDEIAHSLRPRYATISRPVRPFCHNVIADAPTIGQSLLVTEHTLLRLGHHQDLFSDIGNVTFACHDGAFIYYLAENKLFRQRIGDTTAVQIKDLSHSDSDIRFMTILNEQLYYANNNNRLFTAHIYSSYLLNSLLSWDYETNPQPYKDLTAIGHDAKDVYLGIRDGLQQVNKTDGKLQLNGFSNSATLFTDPFITTFSSLSASGNIFFGTLNHGLFIGKHGRFTHIPSSEGLHFVRDIAVVPTLSGRDSLFVLTNHWLFSGTEKHLNVCDTLNAVRRLAATDATHIYGFPDYGVINLNTRQHFFSDIHFNPTACIAINGQVYAGSSCGVYVFNNTLCKQNHMEANYTTVKFEHQQLFSRTHIGLLLALTICVFVMLWLYLSLAAAKRRMLMRIERLKNIIQPLTSVPTEPNEIETEWENEMAKVHHLLHNISCVEKNVKQLNLQRRLRKPNCIDKLNSMIQDITFELPTVLNDCLNQQLDIIKAAHWEECEYITETTVNSIKENESREEKKDKTSADFCRAAVNSILSNINTKKTNERYNRYMLIPDVENVCHEIYRFMHDSDENDIGKSEQNKNVRPLNREEMIKEVDKMLLQINKKGIANNLRNFLQAKLSEIENEYCITVDEKNETYDDAPQCLLRQTMKKAKEQMAELNNVGDAPLTDILSTLISIGNTYQRLTATMILCKVKKIITDFAHKKAVRKSDKDAVKVAFSECVSKFYEATNQCEDKEILRIIGLAHKKSGKKKDRFLNEDMLVMMLAGRLKEQTTEGKIGTKPILSDDQNEDILDADKQSLRRARRAFRNLTTTRLNKTAKQNNATASCMNSTNDPLERLRTYGTAHPECFAQWLVEIIESL